MSRSEVREREREREREKERERENYKSGIVDHDMTRIISNKGG